MPVLSQEASFWYGSFHFTNVTYDMERENESEKKGNFHSLNFNATENVCLFFVWQRKQNKTIEKFTSDRWPRKL